MAPPLVTTLSHNRIAAGWLSHTVFLYSSWGQAGRYSCAASLLWLNVFRDRAGTFPGDNWIACDSRWEPDTAQLWGCIQSYVSYPLVSAGIMSGHCDLATYIYELW
jgi:hypothetical protein